MANKTPFIPKFAEGQGLDYNDLNKLATAATQRAWEWPGYGRLIPHTLVNAVDYASAFATPWDQVQYAYTVGGGLNVTSANTSTTIQPGFLGQWQSTDVLPSNIVDAGGPRMSWSFIDATTIEHTPALAGQYRWVLVTATVQDSYGSETRSFEDGVTRVRTTQATDVRTGKGVTISALEGNSAVSPTMPTLSSNVDSILYAVKVGESWIQEIRNFVMPGGQKAAMTLPALSYVGGSAGWSTANYGRTLRADAGGRICYLLPPSPIMGNPYARILGFQIGYTLSAGASVKAVCYDMSTGLDTEFDTMGTGTYEFNYDGGENTAILNLVGLPNPNANTYRPMWGTGLTNNGNGPVSNTFALKVTTGANLDRIEFVTWYYAAD